MLEVLFWVALSIVLYTYVGYGIIIRAGVFLKRKRQVLLGYSLPSDNRSFRSTSLLPDLTVVIPAYNEAWCIEEKIKNTRASNYPSEKLHILVVADGSDDQTARLASQHAEVRVMHSRARKGKAAAMNRAMHEVQTPYVVFTDANTNVNADALRNIAVHFEDPRVGCVAGEKRINQSDRADASEAGEGLYWKYESTLKLWDAELNSAVGAAGELIAIQTSLYTPLEEDTLLDDFMLSLRIAEQGYKIAYEPDAYALEEPSDSIQEEWKRKVRICAGGFQSIIRLKGLLIPLRRPVLSFQYISHRVLRWTLAPFCIVLLIFLNAFLVNDHVVYRGLLGGQVLFYLAACSGAYLQSYKIKVRWAFIPFYFVMMQAAVAAGFIRFVSKKQSVLWEKAGRKNQLSHT